MIINKVIINNIGLYAGKNEFDLSVDEGKNIILFGGKNGSGKTTFLDAIKTCLYGVLLFNDDTKKYHQFIKKFIRNDKESGSIEISITFYQSNEKVELSITRTWKLKPRSVIESLLMRKNGEVFKGVSQKYWQDYILEIIPFGLINLFFFDGEKIEGLAKDLNKTQVGNAIKNLIGISSLEYLDKCLQTYKNNILDDNNSDKLIREKISNAENRQKEISNELGEIMHIRSDLFDAIKHHNDKISALKQELTNLGGNIINDYSALQKAKELLTNNIISVENQIRELASSYLPLILFPSGLSQLEAQLDEESRVAKYDNAKEIISSKLSLIEQLVISETENNDLFKKIEEILIGYETSDIKQIHGLSETETKDIFSTINVVKKSVVPAANNLKVQLANLMNDLDDVNRAIDQAPKEDLIKPYLDKIKQYADKRNKLEKELDAVEAKHEALYAEDEKLEKDIKRLRNEIENNIKLQHNTLLLNKSIAALGQFRESFVSRKLKQLETCLLENLQLLNRKTDIIRSLEINPKTFQVALFDDEGRIISKSRLSAGERQIFAISLLWSLSMITGKLLPTIIDTPLSRLDSDHRNNIVSSYFKRGSHQMIILSTDEEIDENLHKALQSNLSKQYHLEFNDKVKATSITPRYFWDRQTEVCNEV